MESWLLRRQAGANLDFQGIPITVEHAKGSTRTGADPDGKEWSRKMLCDYGYIKETTPAKGDGEDLDVYVGPDKDAPDAFVVEQLKDDGEFDEFKVILGINSEDEARKLYLGHYPKGWESNIGSIFSVPVERLKDFVDGHDDQ